MSAPPREILYAIYSDILFIKLEGNIRYTRSSDFNRFIDQIFQDEGFNDILFDLTESTGIDSTNLGLLVKVAKLMTKNYNKKTTIVSTCDEINEILLGLGFDKIFIIVSEQDPIPENLHRIPEITETEKGTAKIMLEAHKRLMDLNEENVEKFKNVVEFLQKELEE